MATPYSQDLRDRVLAAYDRGVPTQQIAEMFQVSKAWARRIKQRRRETGEIVARRMGGPGVIKVDRTRLSELVREDPDATLMELRERLGVACAISTICVALRKIGFTFKKRRSTPRSRIGRTSSNAARSGVRGRARSMAGV
jgi:transposase